MIPEFGQFALILALCLSAIQAVFPLLGLRNKPAWQALAKPAAYGQSIFVIISFFILIYSFVTNDFSVAYVAENSNKLLPLIYKISGVWGAHEGSMLLWVTVLALWTMAVARFSKALPNEVRACVLAILGCISFGFLLFILTTSNPFLRLLPDFPNNGQDLNPLLQDPGLAGHPPMLYMGYVGFSVAFAFAIAALLTGRLDSSWARWSRPWTLAAWSFLTAGITLGSWWSYRVLGWGGWWFWDPVENASFLPWLVGTALIHSLAVVEKRGAFKSWSALLALCVFSLSLVGTFLVRSGILTSVHAFAIDPSRGQYMLEFLSVVIGCSLLIYAWRASTIQGTSNFQLLSKETLLLTNNVILFVIMLTILLGTLYPLILQALNLGKLSVGAPYFNAVFIPLVCPLLLVMGLGPLCSWQHNLTKELLKKTIGLFVFSIILAILLPLLFTRTFNLVVILGLILAFWIITSVVKDFLFRLNREKGLYPALKDIPRSQYGMLLAHLGIAITVIGVTLTSFYSTEHDLRMSPGSEAKIGNYQFFFDNLSVKNEKNYQALVATFVISEHNKIISYLHPETRYFSIDQTTTSIPAIKIFVIRDLYIALGESMGNNAWAIRIYNKPFIRWIWYGGLIMVLGGITAATDRRYRERKVKNNVQI